MNIIKRHLWFFLLALGVIGFAVTWVAFPHQKQIDSAWQLIFKLIVYGFIIGSIAFFPNTGKKGYLLVILPFFIFLGYMIPRISYFGFRGAAIGNVAQAGELYTVIYLLLFPLINFTTAFAYRMGGGTPGNCIKISLVGVIIIFSGFLDVMWFLVNPVGIPHTIDEAYHIIIFFGRKPTYMECVVFMLCHIPLLVGAILMPFDKWFNSISKSFDEPSQEVRLMPEGLDAGSAD